tara:strand:+ start:635 stop:1099 length:465 start_codon:yes stop_codon:yes gene_type:complete
MKTYSAKSGEIEPKWFLIDAEGIVLGRLAAVIAFRLRGKHKPNFTPHIDCGDYIVVINASKVKVTGNKYLKKKYYRHTGYPGGIKEISLAKVLEGKNSERALLKAVQRMLPKESPLAEKQFSKLRVYSGNVHPHDAQNPEKLDVASMNNKNTRA